MQRLQILNGLREGDCLWTEFPNLEGDISNLEPRTSPKPDITYAFPIITSSSGKPRGLERDGLVQCLSAGSLGTLRKKNIICSQTLGLRNWVTSKEPLESKDAACFPWAIAEFKRADGESRPSQAKRCYEQAANASAAALEFSANLYSKIIDENFSNIPPIISFTCVGPIVRVWLTYYTRPENHGRHIRVSNSPGIFLPICLQL